MAERRNKYGAKPVYYAGRRFDSKGEGQRFLFLNSCLQAGKIKDLRMQVPFELYPAVYQMRIGARGKPVRGQQLQHGITYTADFVYTLPDGTVVVEDFKGYETPEFLIKERLMHEMRGITLYKPKRPCAPLGGSGNENQTI